MRPPLIDPATTWVVSDTHWGHENIIGFCHRPPDHEQIMMEEWAREVPDEATVLHLGDLSYRNNAFFKHMIAPHLTGERKLLIKGNHDKQRPSFYRDAGFRIVKPFGIWYNGWWVSFDHYPLRNADLRPSKSVHLHGHLHNQGYNGKYAPYTPFAYGQINVSVEQTHYRPVNLKVLLDAYLYGAYDEEMYNLRHREAEDGFLSESGHNKANLPQPVH